MMIIMENGEGNGDVETRSEQVQEEKSIPHILKPNDHSYEVQSIKSSPYNNIDEYVGYRLPFRHNHWVSLNRYSSDHGEKKLKYPITNHILYLHIIATLKAFVHIISSTHIPSTVKDALNDPKWNQVIIEELRALQKNDTWNLMTLPRAKKIRRCK